MESSFKLTVRQAIRITVEFLVICGVVYAGLYAAATLAERHAGIPPVPGLVLELAVFPLSTGWAIWRALRRQGARWSPDVVWRVEPAGLMAPFLLIIVGDAVVVSGMDNVMEALLPSPDAVREMMGEVLNFTGHPFTTFTLVVAMAPFCEEAIMRGVVLRGLLGGTRPGRAIVISAALFAVMHLNPWQMPGAFVGGLILGWAYFRTRSLGLSVAGHSLHNAIGLFSVSLPFEITGFNTLLLPGQAALFQPWWLTLGGIVLFCVGAVWFHRGAPRP